MMFHLILLLLLGLSSGFQLKLDNSIVANKDVTISGMTGGLKSCIESTQQNVVRDLVLRHSSNAVELSRSLNGLAAYLEYRQFAEVNATTVAIGDGVTSIPISEYGTFFVQVCADFSGAEICSNGIVMTVSPGSRYYLTNTASAPASAYVSNALVWPQGDWTFESYVYLSDFSDSSLWGTGSNSYGCLFSFDSSQAADQLLFCVTTAGNLHYWASGTSASTGLSPPQQQWFHFAVVGDRSAATANIYFDGVLKTTVSFPMTDSTPGSFAFFTDGGTAAVSSSYFPPKGCRVANTRLWNYALPTSSVVALSDSNRQCTADVGSESSLVLRYSYDPEIPEISPGTYIAGSSTVAQMTC